MKLKDIKGIKNDSLTAEQSLIARIVSKSSMVNHVVWNNGRLDIDGTFNFKNLSVMQLDNFVKDGELQVPFGKITDGFSCYGLHLKSFKNFPTFVGGLLNCNENEFTDFEYCTPIISSTLSVIDNNITSLHNIHKHIKTVKYINLRTNYVKDSILGLLLIENFSGALQLSGRQIEPFKILNSYASQGLGKPALFDCQQEMIDAGFEEYAQL